MGKPLFAELAPKMDGLIAERIWGWILY